MTITLERVNGAPHPAPPPVPLTSVWPAEPWPRADAETAEPAAVPAPKLSQALAALVSRLHLPDGDTVITWSMAATVALVAVDAAIVSYSHIYGLATGQWGSGAETGVQARLLPLSIDGVIAEASLVKLFAARHRVIGKTKLATFMLWLGIVATVAANVTHGLPSTMLSPVVHVVIMALLSAWPAGAFIGSVEMAMGLVRNKRAVASGSDTDGDTDGDSDSDEMAGQGSGGGDKKAPVTRRRKVTADPVADAIRKGWGDDKIVTRCGVSKRTVQRRRAEIDKAKQATGAAP